MFYAKLVIFQSKSVTGLHDSSPAVGAFASTKSSFLMCFVGKAGIAYGRS